MFTILREEQIRKEWNTLSLAAPFMEKVHQSEKTSVGWVAGENTAPLISELRYCNKRRVNGKPLPFLREWPLPEEGKRSLPKPTLGYNY